MFSFAALRHPRTKLVSSATLAVRNHLDSAAKGSNLLGGYLRLVTLAVSNFNVVQSAMALSVEESAVRAGMPESENTKHRPVPAKLLQDYLETLVEAQSFQVSNLRNWTLIQCYAELQFKLNGGSKCPVCRAHVRHVVPVHVLKEEAAA